MSATDFNLRKLLDECGAEYEVDEGYREYFWEFGESGKARASYIGTKGLVQMIVTGVTPAQAIAATLGVVEYRKPTTLSKLEAENAELREFCVRLNTFAFNCYHGVFDQEVFFRLREKYHELGIEEDT